MFFVDNVASSDAVASIGPVSRASLGLKGKLLSVEYEDEKRRRTVKKTHGGSVEEFCGLMGWNSKIVDGKPEKPAQDFLQLSVEKELQQDFKTHELEREHSLKKITIRQKKKMNKELRDKSKGGAWYGLPAPEMTEEVKNDLQVLQMRSVLDPKHFYKKNDLKVLPKYFQVGKYEDSPLDYHNEKHVKKSNKKSIVDDLLKDAEFQRRVKKKYAESLMNQKPKYYGRAGKNKKRDDNKSNNKKHRKYFDSFNLSKMVRANCWKHFA